MFDHDDDSRGFWDDEPTRPLERLTARMKPAGSPPPQPTRMWPSRANQPTGRSHDDTQSIPVVSVSPGRRMPVPPRVAPQRAAHDRLPTRQVPLYDQTMFDDLDDDFGYDTYGNNDADTTREVWGDDRWGSDRRWGSGRAPRTGADDRWPASVGQAFGMAARKGRELLQGRGSQIDPLMRRMGALVLIIGLCVPLALTLRGGESQSKGIRPEDSTLAMGTLAADTTAATQPPVTPAPTSATVPATAAAVKVATVSKKAAAAPVCVKTYTVVKGDFWVRIASKSGITLKEVLAANNAEKTTLLLPGKTVCLPANATTPAAPAAAPVAAAPTPAPAAPAACTKKYTIVKGDAWSSIASRSSITTTQLLAANNATTKTVLLPGKTVCLPANATTPPPPTTQAPTTTTAPKPALKTYTRAEVQQIIRDVFPDELEAYAMIVAERESHFNQYSANYCCYGVFQINFNAHKKWLVNYGVTNPQQLLDPVVNVKMAYIVYQRSNGWGPWGG